MSTGNQTVDPVCGMTVDPKTALSSFKDGETFYSCSQHSLEKFTGSRETGVDTMSNIRQSLFRLSSITPLESLLPPQL